MPQATPELRAEWEDDQVAMKYLRDNGYKLLKTWWWLAPDREPTPKEIRAIDYMFQEWDFGGFLTREEYEKGLTQVRARPRMRDAPREV